MLRSILLLLLVTVVVIFGNVLASPLPEHYSIFMENRIIGGEPVDIKEYPHQISLQYRGAHRCGGAVILPDVILTAAHCVKGIGSNDLQVRAGSSSKNSGGILAPVKSFTYHEKYNPSTIDYDVAVIFLTKPLSYDATIQPIEIAKLEAASDAVAIVSGWGNMQEGGSSPVQLQAVKIRIISQQNCRDYYGDDMITDRMMCAGVPEGGKGSCQGDSGGALTVNGEVVGVVSWAYGCSRPNVPTVFGNVVNLRDWITTQITNANI